jgi:hypothetical protein
MLEEVGRILLLIVGCVFGAAGTIAVLKKHSNWGVLLSYVFSGALVGVGTFGPTFLESYGKFLEPILEQASKENYEKFAKDVASGKVPEQVAQIGLEHMIANPVEGLDDVLESAAAGASQARREVLEDARRQHVLNKERALAFVATPRFKELGEHEKAIATKPLIDVDDARLAPTGINRELIRKLNRIPSR